MDKRGTLGHRLAFHLLLYSHLPALPEAMSVVEWSQTLSETISPKGGVGSV
jgi:hypothetical protein